MGAGCGGAGVLDVGRSDEAVIEVCDHYGVAPRRLSPRHVDAYLAGVGKRQAPTVRSKLNRIDHFFAFLERRYAQEIFQRFGAVVESPVDPFNRQAHRGDFGLRVPPSARAVGEFFADWRKDLVHARKEAVACRDYVMSKLIYITGVRASELCQMRMKDLHWEAGDFGRFVVQGKGARGSGPRQWEAFLFAEGRELLWWYVEDIRGLFADDPEGFLVQFSGGPAPRAPAGACGLRRRRDRVGGGTPPFLVQSWSPAAPRFQLQRRVADLHAEPCPGLPVAVVRRTGSHRGGCGFCRA